MNKSPPSPSIRKNLKLNDTIKTNNRNNDFVLPLNDFNCRKKLDAIGSVLQNERLNSARPDLNKLELPKLDIGSRCTSAPNDRNFTKFQMNNNNQNTIQPKLEIVDPNKYNEIRKNAGYLLINKERIKTNIEDLITIGELGSGTCGQVIKMKHNQTGQQIAVKQMGISGIVEENKRIIMDLDVVLKCHDCENIVSCLGYFITDCQVWICMDLMSMCFDKLLKLTKKPIPEIILGKLAFCTLNALNYLKEKHNVIHRDVKPSNLLINEQGDIKLCDFGISGNLVDSKAQSRNAGCAGYLSPERIDSENRDYDIRADVWSLGITLVELATGQYPYKHCNSDFEVMSTIIKDDAPKLVGDEFSENFKSFVQKCLIKEVSKRPKYNILLQDPFVLQYKQENVDVKSWFNNLINSTQ